MYMEDEAKTKWCPVVRVGNRCKNRDSTYREGGDIDSPFYRCIASSCMMWRRVVTDHYISSTYGYCGLAGKE
jgi:hypothetical protein